MKVAITGATGYLGGQVLQQLVKQDPIDEIAVILNKKPLNFYNDKITLYDNDVKSIQKALHGANAVIHFAALYKTGIQANDVHAMSTANIQLTADIMAVASAENVRVIMPTTFSMFNSRHEYEPRTFYAATKMFAEQTAKLFDTNVTFLRFPDTFGSDDERPKLINLLINAVRTHKPMRTRKPGSFKMNAIAVEDIENIVLRILDRPKEVQKDKIMYYDLFYPENQVSIQQLIDVIDSKHKYLSTVNDNVPAEVIDNPQLMPGYSIQYPILQRIKKEVSSLND